MPTLLIIGYVWPEPESSAAGYRMMALLQAFLDQGWKITFASPAERTPHKADLNTLGVDEVAIVLNCSSFDNFVSELAPNVVLFDRFMMEEQFGWRVENNCPSALRILDTEDLSSLRYSRQEAFKRDGVINPPLTPELLFTDNARREIAAILRCDLTLMISEVETDLLTRFFKVDPCLLLYLPFMLKEVNIVEKGQLPPFIQRESFIAIGNYRHLPNWDAVQYLKESIWPLIRQQLPQAELHIHGAYPPKKATQLHSKQEGFLIKGWAPDVTEVMRQAKVNLAPLRFGAGLKGKLLDAMRCGTPSVTTSIGAEGMAGNLPLGGEITDNPDVFAERAVALYTQPEQWYQAQSNGFNVLDARFNYNYHARKLLKKIDELINNLTIHRQNNFTGSILRHNSMKSTKYMSKWIEEKNKNQR